MAVAPLLLYLAVMILVTWPLSLQTEFLGHAFSDTYEYARHMWWIKTALQTGQPLFDQLLLGYPDGLSGLWLWANPLQSFPGWLFAFVMPLPAAFNIALLLRMTLNGWAMYLLTMYLTGDKRGPSMLAGLVFMLYPTFQGQLAIGHSGLLLLWPVPLYIYALLRLRDTRQGRWIIAAALLFVVSLWGNILLLIYLLAPVTLFFGVQYLLRRDGPNLRRLLQVILLGGLLSFIFVGPFLIEELQKPPRLGEGGDVLYSADLLTLVTPAPQHPVFGNFDYTGRILGIDPFERMGYIGLVPLLLTLIALWRRPASRPWLVLAVLAWILSLGPLLKVLDTVVTVDLNDHISYVTLPWLVLQDLPFVNTTRTPARFNFTLALAVAVMVGYGASIPWDRLPKLRWGLILGLAALVVFEYQAFWPLPKIPGIVPEPVRVLAERDDIRAVMNLPWSHLLAQKDGMFLQTWHHKPLIAGHVTRRTPLDPAKLSILESTLDPALLDREGVDIIILHKQWAAESDLERLLQLAEPVYEDERIAAYEVPDADGSTGFQAVYDTDFSLGGRRSAYLFAPESGWVNFSGGAQTSERDLRLSLGDQLIWQTSDDSPMNLPLFLSDPGYYSLTFAVEPPCPAHHLAVLECQSAQVLNLAVDDFQPAESREPVKFDSGLSLTAYTVEMDEDDVSVNMNWQFSLARQEDEIRFVHVVDSNGDLVTQSDATLGQRPAGSAWMEQIVFPDLPPGKYDLYTGWYTYPDFTRFAVLSDLPDAVNGWVHLGQVQLD